MPNRNISIIIGVLAVFVIAGVMVFITQKPAPQPKVIQPTITQQPSASSSQRIEPSPQKEVIDTSDWKVYRNEKYGFEFKYPSDWLFSQLSGYNLPQEGWQLVFLEQYLPNEETTPRSRFEFGIISFSKDEVEEYNRELDESVKRGEPIGDAGIEIWISPKVLEQEATIPCELHISSSAIHDCQIVKIGANKFMRYVATNIWTDDVRIGYRIARPNSERWLEFSLNFGVITKYDPYNIQWMNAVKLLEQLNKPATQSEIVRIIRSEISNFDQVLATFRFIE